MRVLLAALTVAGLAVLGTACSGEETSSTADTRLQTLEARVGAIDASATAGAGATATAASLIVNYANALATAAARPTETPIPTVAAPTEVPVPLPPTQPPAEQYSPPPPPAPPPAQPPPPSPTPVPTYMLMFNGCLNGWEEAQMLATLIVSERMAGIDPKYEQQQLDAVVARVSVCPGIGAQAASTPGASASCGTAIQRASTANALMPSLRMSGVPTIYTQQELAELDAFIAAAC